MWVTVADADAGCWNFCYIGKLQLHVHICNRLYTKGRRIIGLQSILTELRLGDCSYVEVGWDERMQVFMVFVRLMYVG